MVPREYDQYYDASEVMVRIMLPARVLVWVATMVMVSPGVFDYDTADVRWPV